MEPRIIELELRYTEQQSQLQQISDVVYAQQRAIDALTADLGRLAKKLEAEPGIIDARADERPPHY